MKPILLVALLAFATPAGAQTYWRYSSGVAGATMGGAFGLMVEATRSATCGISLGSSSACGAEYPLLPWVMAAGVGLLGFTGGLSLDHALARGETLSRMDRFRLKGQLVITPMLLPPLLLSQVRPEKTRQQLSWLGVAGGALLGYRLQRKFEPAMWPRTKVGVSPTRSGVTLQLSTQW